MEIAIIPEIILSYIINDTRKKNDINILISNILIVLTFIIFSKSLIYFLDTIPHFCLFKNLTTLDCPACGITRAFCEISVGNFSEAYKLNSTSFIIISYIISQIPIRIILIYNENYRIKLHKLSKKASQLILIVLAINWIT